MTLTELIIRAEAAIVPIGHSQSTVYQYGLAWKELTQYFQSNGQIFFTADIASLFVKQAQEQLQKGKIKIWRYKLYRLSVAILIEVYHTGEYQWKFHHRDPNDFLHADHRRIYDAFQEYLVKLGKSNGTRSLYGTITRQFFSCLQNELHKSVPNLGLADIREIIVSISKSYQKTSMRTALSALRVFLSFLWMTGETEIKLTVAVPSSGSRKVAVIPTLTAEEEVQLLQSTDRSTCLGKRNYAIILLAMRTGLRTVDIINLKLKDIDWRSNTMTIIQQKNRKPLCLPVLPDVGNALAEYILHARPESSSPYLFLKIFPPFEKLTDCYHVSRKAFGTANIRQEFNQSKGLHVFRHSLASKMLASKVRLSVISNALGHSSMECSKMYLSSDSTHLKACALTLKGIEVSKEELL